MIPKYINKLEKPSVDYEFRLQRYRNSYKEKYHNLNSKELKDKYQNKYQKQEEVIEKIFELSSSFKEVLLKVTVLNDFYSTNIFDTYNVACHIWNLNNTENLSYLFNKGDLDIVNKIADTPILSDPPKRINLYSFATKYCSFHQPEKYPIYDKYVDTALYFFESKLPFYKAKENNNKYKKTFTRESLKSYEQFKYVIDIFRENYELEKYKYKEIDQYLWQVGKDILSIDDKIKKLLENSSKTIQEKIYDDIRIEVDTNYIESLKEMTA